MVSPSFELEPTETNMRWPSSENATSRVVWPPVVSASCATMVSGAARALRSPLRYGKRTTALRSAM